MFRYISFYCILCLSLICAGTARADLIISQIMFNMAGDDTVRQSSWEWVELYNNGVSDVDISGYCLDDGNSYYNYAANIPFGVVPAGGVIYLINAESNSPTQFIEAWGPCNVAPIRNMVSHGLNNGGDFIGIWDSYSAYAADIAASTTVSAIEVIDYGADSPWPIDLDGISIYLTNLSADNNDGANWAIADTTGVVTATGGTVKTGVETTYTHYASIVNLTPDEPDITGDGVRTFGAIATSGAKTLDILVKNLGTSANLDIISVNFTGAGASDFSVSGTLPTGIAPGATDVITVEFDPSSEGVSESVMQITSNDAGGDTHLVLLQGIAYDTPLIISGIMYNPAGTEGNWEFVEIYNPTSTEVDLSGYVLDDNNTSRHSAATIASGTVGAFGTAYLSGGSVSAASFAEAWGGNIDAIFVDDWGGMGLNNTGDTVGLWNSYEAYSWGDHVTHSNAMESVTYQTGSGGWPSSVNGSALYLVDVSADNDDSANWELSNSGNLGTTPANGTGGIITQSIDLNGNGGNDFSSIKEITMVVQDWENY